MSDLSPAVERALQAVTSVQPTVGDWLTVLLAEEEGRPAMALEKLGISASAVRQQVQATSSTMMDSDTLLRRAREHSIRLRADPQFTTDFLMLAALYEDAILAEALGVRLDVLDASLRSPLVAGPTEIPVVTTPFEMPLVTDRGDAARILDVNFNRALESLRVLDDFARFVRNDAGLTESAKKVRHRLADLASHLPLKELLAARNTSGDVGTTIEATGEYDRSSPEHVAHVNIKRLQESLRSLEEYGKILSPFASREVEAIRYETYTLERALFGGSPLRDRIAKAQLYLLVSGESCTAALDWTVEEAIAGGVDVVQLREKGLADRELLVRAERLRIITAKAGALLIINDRPDLALLSGADGVHLGQEDFPAYSARRVLGPRPLLGISTHHVAQVHAAVRDGADYIGIGPCFPSTTKSFEILAGPAFITAAMKETGLPAFALGGINAKTITAAVEAGARRVAVSAAITKADDPRLAATLLRNALL